MVVSRILHADHLALWTEEVSARSPLASFSTVDLPETSETGEGKAAASLCEDLILHVQLLTGVGLVQPHWVLRFRAPSWVECSIVIVLQLEKKLVSKMLHIVIL